MLSNSYYGVAINLLPKSEIHYKNKPQNNIEAKILNKILNQINSIKKGQSKSIEFYLKGAGLVQYLKINVINDTEKR